MIWLWIGDSITESMKPYLDDLYAQRGDQVVVAAHTGWTTRRWLDEGNIQDLIRQSKANAVVFALGTNDVAQGDRIDVDLVRRVASIPQTRNVIWIGPFNSSPDNDAITHSIGGRVDGPGVVNGYEAALGICRGPDGVHFTPQGYQDLAVRLVDRVDREMPVSIWIPLSIGAVLVLISTVVLWKIIRGDMER